MPTWWIYAVAGGFVLSVVLTDVVMLLAKRFQVLDHPDGGRKRHARAIPLMGGAAIYTSFAIVMLALLLFTDHLTAGDITAKQIGGFLFGGLILIVGGILDDKFDLSPKKSIWFPVLAALAAVSVGIGPSKITNPIGGAFDVPEVISAVFTFAWLMGMIYTTKLLDGLDGLATGVSSIGALMIALLALSTTFYQPDVGLMALVAFAILLGFLLWNTHPAQVFLGEGGSTFVGYMIGVLAIISGSKVATALLVVGVPALDVFFVLTQRVLRGGSPAVGDRLHLHHKLGDLGLSQRQIVAIYYLVALLFGLTTLIFESWQKLLALAILAILMLVLILILSKRTSKV